jgi:HAD superfamily hydrolase (TIGR01509 family)
LTIMKGINGVFFDLHGTLLLSPDFSAAWEEWHDAFHLRMTEHGLTMSREEFKPYTEGLFKMPEPEYVNAEMTLFERRVKDLGDRLDLDIDHGHIRRTVEHIIEVWQRDMYLDPEAPEVLGVLRSRLKLAMITNWDHAPRIPRLLSELGIDEHFEKVVISDQVGVAKPDPEIFHIALNKTGLEPSEVAYVGDSPEDVQGSQAAGVHPILIRRDSPRGNRVFDPDAESMLRFYASGRCEGVTVIRRLRDLLDLF